MPKLQVKTEKIITFIKRLKSRLKENNDLSIYISGSQESKTLNISYNACVRRDTRNSVAKRYKNNINTFVELCNETTFAKKKIKKIDIKHYEDDEDYEYDEYEIEVGQDITIEKVGQAKIIADMFQS